MPWRAAPRGTAPEVAAPADIPGATAANGPSDSSPPPPPPLGPDAASAKPEPDSLASSNCGNDSPRTDKTPWQPALSPPAPDADSEPDRIGVPDGGLRAWLVVLGAFVDFMVAFGLMNSFGVFQARYEVKWPGLGTSTVTWIGSTQLFVFFAGGSLVGPAFDKYGARILMLLGTGCCLVSFICTSWASQFWHFLLAQGLLFGLSNALLFYPVTGAISEWFDKRRGLALGIAVSGSSIGGIVWPILLSKLFNDLSEEKVHRVVTIISAPLLILSCYLVRERKEVAGRDTSGNQARPSQTSACGAVFEWRFLALSSCLMLLYCGMLIPFYYVPLYALDYGFDHSTANHLLVITYTGSFFGRIASGWLADRFGRFNILSLVGTLMGAMTLAWIWMTSLAGMTAFATLFGLLSGGLGPLGSVCVAQTTPDMGHIGLRIGIMMLFSSVGALSGGPISGMLRDGSTGWIGVHAFSAGMSVAGALLLFGVRLWHRPYALARF